jgi:hypothetical protein
MYDKQNHFKAIYKKIIVTYLDGSKKEFNPAEWALFQKRIESMKTKSIEKVLKPKTVKK